MDGDQNTMQCAHVCVCVQDYMVTEKNGKGRTWVITESASKPPHPGMREFVRMRREAEETRA